MALEQLTRTVDFVQDATPSATDANDGETYLDTSLTPPRLKIFDEDAGSFIEPSGAALTRFSGSYDVQTTDLVEKTTSSFALQDISVNAFGTGALELTNSDGVFGLQMGSDINTTLPTGHGDFNLAQLDANLNGFVDLAQLTGNAGFNGVDAQVFEVTNNNLRRRIPTDFFAVSSSPVRQYRFQCDNGNSSPYTFDGLDNTSVLTTTDISGSVSVPEDIITDLNQVDFAVLDSGNDKVFGFASIGSSTPFGSTDISGQTTTARSIAYDKRTENRFYVADDFGKIYVYESNGFSPDNLNFIGSVDRSSQVGFDGNATITGLEFGDLGRHMYIASRGRTDLLHYRVGEVTPTYE